MHRVAVFSSKKIRENCKRGKKWRNYVVEPADNVDAEESGAGTGAGGGGGGEEVDGSRRVLGFLRPPTESDRKNVLVRGGAADAASWRAERLRMPPAFLPPLAPLPAAGHSRRTARPFPGMTQVKTTPILARRLTQRGMRARTRRRQAASQKWLQLRDTRLYASPGKSAASSAMSARTSARVRSVVPTSTDSRNVYPGHRRGTTSKIPLLGPSCAPYAYSTP